MSFLTHSELLPNVPLMRNLGFDARTTSLSKDGRFTMLEYTKIQGDHTLPVTADGFKGVAQVLEKMHGWGYIHGDVRVQNMVFNRTNRESYMIDFDLSRLETNSPRYPKNYNFQYFHERHSNAQPFSLMMFIP